MRNKTKKFHCSGLDYHFSDHEQFKTVVGFVHDTNSKQSNWKVNVFEIKITIFTWLKGISTIQIRQPWPAWGAMLLGSIQNPSRNPKYKVRNLTPHGPLTCQSAEMCAFGFWDSWLGFLVLDWNWDWGFEAIWWRVRFPLVCMTAEGTSVEARLESWTDTAMNHGSFRFGSIWGWGWKVNPGKAWTWI